MTTTEPSKTGPTFASLDPRDGTVLAEYPIAGAEEVALAVERARAAARWWATQGPRGRRGCSSTSAPSPVAPTSWPR